MRKIGLFCLIFLRYALSCFAQPGELDSSFGTNGIITTDLGTSSGSYGNSMVASTTGDLYIVVGTNGSSYINKLSPNGFLDSSYGKNGFSGFVSFDTRKAELQADGKVILVGRTSKDIAVARFNTDGRLDNTFGSKGIRLTNFGAQVNIGNAVAIQSDGKIVVAGEIFYYSNEDEYTHFAIVRYSTDGSLDSTFSEDGMETNDTIGPAYSLQIRSDGKIIAVTNSAIAHFNSDGSLDNTFGSNGIQFIDNNSLSTFQTDGKILAIGQAGSYPNIDFGIARYDADGTLDTTFLEDGKVTTDIDGNFDQAQSVIVQSDGKIVVGGFSGGYFALVRYNKDGTLDSAFADNGIKITKASPGSNGINSIVISNNKLYAAGRGYSSSASLPHILGILARYLLNDENKVVPTVSILAPVSNASFPAPANIHFVAGVTDPNSRVTKVEFYNNNRLIGTAEKFPYTFTWSKVPLGNYSFTAKAVYDKGLEVTSDAVHISVVPNKPPTVSIIKPSDNEHYAAPAYIHFEAAASDTNGRITRVEFYNGSTLLRTEYKYPYTYVWKNIPEGIYTITAVATDNWGAQTTSKAIVVKVKSSICSKEEIMTFKAYIDGSDYIHVKGSQVWYEHLNFELPGKWEGANEPTYINGNTWFLEWPDNISNIYTLLNPPLASSGISDVTLEVISARGTVTLTQVPDVNNNYEAVIFADDDAPAGADWYEFNLKWKVIGDCISDSNVRHVHLRQPRMNRSALGEKGQIVKVTGDLKNNVNIYPNPFQSRLKVELTSANIFQKIITLFDVNGKQVFNYSSRQNLIEINVKPLPNGIYFIRVNDGIGKLLYSGKVVKE